MDKLIQDAAQAARCLNNGTFTEAELKRTLNPWVFAAAMVIAKKFDPKDYPSRKGSSCSGEFETKPRREY